jgi:uncharacterized protein YkwD
MDVACYDAIMRRCAPALILALLLPACSDDGDSPEAIAEEQVLDLVNEARAAGHDCGVEGVFPPTTPLVMEAHLRAAARAHSLDMATRAFFEHTNPDGDGPLERIEAAGYTGWTMLGENIAAGQPTAEIVVAGWLDSDGHCANIMSPDFTEIGVGYASVAGSPYTHYWTQDFGRR